MDLENYQDEWSGPLGCNPINIIVIKEISMPYSTVPHVDFPSVGIAKSNISFQTCLIFLFPDNSCVARMTGELLDSPLLSIVYHPFLESASKIRQ